MDSERERVDGILQDRWMTNRHRVKRCVEKAGLDWETYLEISKRIGAPGTDNQAEWIAAAEQIGPSVPGVPKAFDWQALLAQLLPILIQMLQGCITPAPLPTP
jgi:hypothetical protein